MDQENDSDLEDFGGLPEKKPKKSSKTVSFVGADDVDAGGDEDEDGAEFSDKANLENRSRTFVLSFWLELHSEDDSLAF